MQEQKAGILWKASAWGNIAVQILLPVAQVFTPAISHARTDESPFLFTGSGQIDLPVDKNREVRTRKYMLKEGETVFTVARDHNISLVGLFRLNDHRKYPDGFDSLRPGDEIRVPEFPQRQLPSLELKAGDQDDKTAPGDTEGAKMKLASAASQAGSFFSAAPGGHEASALARSSLSGALTTSVQQWMAKAGTARISVDIDEKFSLKNSQAEMLVPLYENRDWLTFTQGALHHTDGRSQYNLGMGVRHFTPDVMTGGNIFLDYDLSRSHARIGMGGEYWRDYLKLNANSYLRLTSWKDAPELEDYEARPANGWDIRAQGWLPGYPQLGGKLMLEKYYGREVALFGKDQRQHNPYAVTAGINYTPFPLLTLNAEQRQGQSGVNDTRLGLEVNYQLAMPWHQQLASDAVQKMRTLAGSRYDLVERNNNIILDYRKKEVIRLFTHPLITGYAGEKKSLGVSVNSKYGLEHISWSASALLSAGGKLIQEGTEWSVVLPDLKTGSGAVNTWHITAVAVDKKGNSSKRTDTQVTVTQAAINPGTSTLLPSAIRLAANGETQKLTLKISDSAGKPVDIAAKEISTAITPTSGYYSKTSATVSDFTRTAAGQYVATLKAGTRPESFTLTASARNVLFASVSVAITADNTTALINRMDVVTNGALANGQAANKIKLMLVDANTNPVATQSVSIKATNGAVVPATVMTDAKGEASASVTSVHAGEVTVTAGVNGNEFKEAKLLFIADKASSKIAAQDLTVTPASSVADGQTPKTLTVKVTDAQGNPVPDMTVEVSAENGAIPALKRIKTNAQGSASTTLTSKVAGTARVKVSVNNTVTVLDTLFTGHTATALVASVATPHASGVADGTSPVTFRAIIQDQHGNLLSGVPVDWKSDKDSSVVVFSKDQTHTNAQGIAETTLTSTRAHAVVVTASTNASSTSAKAIDFMAHHSSGTVKQLTSDRNTLIASGADAAQIRVQVEDSHGNPLQGVKVALRSQGGQLKHNEVVTNASGSAVSSVTTTRAGQVNIEALLENGAKKALSLQADADAQSAVVSVTSGATTAIAGQSQPVTLTATVRDANNNPVSGAAVSWQADHNQLNKAVSVTNNQGQTAITLTGTEAVNTTVTAVLYNGNVGTTHVAFGPGKPDNGSLTLSPQTITADGRAAAIATLLLKDRWGNPVPGETINWTSDEASMRFAATEKGQGIYQASVTGTREGTWGVIATSRRGGVNLQTSVGLLASQKSAKIKQVMVSGSNTAKANGSETVTLRVQVEDTNGNTRLKGVAVGWDAAFGMFSSRISHTNDQGIAEIKLSSRQAGKVRVSAMLGGGTPVQADKEITFSAGGVDAGESAVSIYPASIVAEKENATVTVTARDTEGNLLPGLKNKITLRFTPDNGMTTAVFDEVSPGIYQAKLTGKKVGTTTMTAVIDGVTVSQNASLAISVDSSSAVVKGAISVSQSRATVDQFVTYSAILTDKNGNALKAGVPVPWSANDGSVLSAQVTLTDSAGKAEVTLTRQKVGTAKVKVILPSGTTPAPEVTFSAGAVDEGRSELMLTPATIAAGKESAMLVLMLRDKNGNPLPGQKVDVESSRTRTKVTPGVTQETADKPGQYTTPISSTEKGVATLTVKVNGKSFTENKSLTIKGDTSSWRITQVSPDKKSFKAGEAKGVTYRATVTDVHGNTLPDVVVAWHLRGQSQSYAPTSRTDSFGVAKTTVLSQTAGELHMTASLDEKNQKQADSVTVLPGDVAAISTLTSDKNTLGSDGQEAVTFTVQLKDQYGNVISGKKVSFQMRDKLPGFTLKPVKEDSDGIYRATATATTKGRVILSAWVEGKKVGNDLTIEVGAISPTLHFDNARQSTPWTKNYAASQRVKGMPPGLQQMWSTTDNSIATVDNTGTVTLHKAGTVSIVVQTSGNEQYHLAQARYELTINRANPQLKAGTGSMITAEWADGKKHSVPIVFDNPDVVKDKLAPVYTSKDTRVVTVNNAGALTPVKPGGTTIVVSTPQTEVFDAASVEVTYTLGRGTLPINFATPHQIIKDEPGFTLQELKGVPREANVTWKSSDNKVVELEADGKVKKVSKGRTVVTATSNANDYFNASSGDYIVEIYTKPAISIDKIEYTNAGKTEASGDWTPVFTDDDLKINLDLVKNDEYSKAEGDVMILVKDRAGKEFLRQAVPSTAVTQTVRLAPTKELWGKELVVDVEAKGPGGTQRVTSNPIKVENLPPNKIWKKFDFKTALHATSQLGKVNTCQGPVAGSPHSLSSWADKDSEVNFGGKTLLAPMVITAYAEAFLGNHAQGDFVAYPDTEQVITDKKLGFSTSGGIAVRRYCKQQQWGGWYIAIKVKYDEKTHEYSAPNLYWDGMGTGLASDKIFTFN